jgi:hypothetical protein
MVSKLKVAIPDPGSQISDPGVKKAPDPGSATLADKRRDPATTDASTSGKTATAVTPAKTGTPLKTGTPATARMVTSKNDAANIDATKQQQKECKQQHGRKQQEAAVMKTNATA